MVLELASLLALLCFSFDGYPLRMQHRLPLLPFDPVRVFSAPSCTLLPPCSGAVSAAPRLIPVLLQQSFSGARSSASGLEDFAVLLQKRQLGAGISVIR